MKKLVLILLIGIINTSWSNGQDIIQEAYFHELKGLEDSSEVTHLFYRFYKKSLHECAPGNDNDIVDNISNDVIHFNTLNNRDNIKFSDGFAEWCLDGMYDGTNVLSYDFYENDPEKWVVIINYDYLPELNDFMGNFHLFEIPIAVKSNNEDFDGFFFPYNHFLSPNNDSLYIISDNETIRYPAIGKEWPKFEDYEEFHHFVDSTFVPYKLIAIHPAIDSLYFAVNSSGDLYRSEYYSKNFTLADSIGYFRDIHFDADSIHIYSLHSSSIGRSDELGKKESWEFIDIPFQTKSSKFITIDKSTSGHIYISDSTTILNSDNYGDAFIELLSVEHEITGLYKKPDSDILYVLTREELLEVNVETKQTKTLKRIPVSNEPEPSEIPKQISLEQNYPNPFNPSTVISYQLAGNSLVRLEVFDVTGRKMAVLVDGERKPAGSHRVTFEAWGLSSGVYFYRLEAGGQTFTQKMMLVK